LTGRFLGVAEVSEATDFVNKAAELLLLEPIAIEISFYLSS
jgi:hypothetical protein